MSFEQKFCLSCHHHQKQYDGWCGYSVCARPLADERDPVDGRLTRRVWKSCDSERRSNKTLFGRVRCGPDARFFTERSA